MESALPSIEAEPSVHLKRRLLAAALSAVFPGLGHWLLGKKGAAVGFLIAFCVLDLLYWPRRLPRSYAGMQVLLFAMMILCVVAGWSALRTTSVRAAIASRTWLFLVIPAALLISFGHSNWLLRAAQFRIYGVPSTAMERTIPQGDRIVADLLQYRHSKSKPRDIILFRRDDTVYVKRVAATSGSIISGKEGVVVVDGVQLEEPYVEHVGNPPNELVNFGPIRIPPGQVFVMGDNRDVSYDSRMPGFGLVSEDTILGKALYIIRSKSRKETTLR